MATYAHPEALVDTQWVADHLDDPMVRTVQVDSSLNAYDSGHVPGAVLWTLYGDMLQPDNRLKEERAAVEALLSRSGIAKDTTVVLYSGPPYGAAPATFGFWLLKAYGHRDVRLMNGGLKKWVAEGRPVTTEAPMTAPSVYEAREPDWTLRARRDLVQQAIGKSSSALVDVRNPREYGGEMFWPTEPPKEGERAGHIPGAVHIPLELALNGDGTFKSVEELRALYAEKGVTPDKQVIPYCTVGGRSSMTWFVLSQLLGYPDVRLYDASWYEWGRLPDVPVEQ